MLVILTKEINNRLSYVFEFIFGDILHVPFSFTNTAEDFKNHQGARLNYSEEIIDTAVNLLPHSLLFEKGISYQNLEPAFYNEASYFFKSSEQSFLPFDPFAASFFLLTRYEEYLEKDFGKYRRYPSKHSILHRNGLLQTPIINKWAYLIAGKIKERFPDFKYRTPRFDYLTTVDIDNAWAYKNKSILRTCGACLRAVARGDINHLKERYSVISGKADDPYDTYNFLTESYKEKPDKLRFFVLAGRPGKYDRNVSPDNKEFQKLVKQLSEDFAMGIHPSYGSVRRKKRLKQEILTLENIIQQSINSSRQHFLKLQLPQTYRRLIKARIRNDYTMGYAEQIGFRAGTATPFHFYDLIKERKTSLLVHPFQMMDVTLNNYLKLKPEEAFLEVEKMMVEIKNYGGTFISLWHNESLNDQDGWKGWKEVFTKITNLAIEFSNEE